MTIRRFLSPALAVARHRAAPAILVLAATFAGVVMVAGPAHAASTFNPIVNGGNGKCLDHPSWGQRHHEPPSDDSPSSRRAPARARTGSRISW